MSVRVSVCVRLSVCIFSGLPLSLIDVFVCSVCTPLIILKCSHYYSDYSVYAVYSGTLD